MNRTGLFLFIAVVILAGAAYWYYTTKMKPVEPTGDQMAPVTDTTTAPAPDGTTPAPAPDGTTPAPAPDGTTPAPAPDGTTPAPAPDGTTPPAEPAPAPAPSGGSGGQ